MTRRDIADLAVQMAGENPQWGYSRIQGALANLGHEVGRNTVKRIRQDHGIDSAFERGRHTPWKTFLLAHWSASQLPTSLRSKCSRSPVSSGLVFFVIELQTRRHVSQREDESFRTKAYTRVFTAVFNGGSCVGTICCRRGHRT